MAGQNERISGIHPGSFRLGDIVLSVNDNGRMPGARGLPWGLLTGFTLASAAQDEEIRWRGRRKEYTPTCWAIHVYLVSQKAWTVDWTTDSATFSRIQNSFTPNWA